MRDQAAVRILIYGLNYAPEFVGVGKYTGELAEWLVQQGHEVRIVCAPPYYPQWRVYPPYRSWRYQRENVNGVDVFRCPLWIPADPSGLSRIFHLISFGLLSTWGLVRSLLWKPNCLLLVLPTLVCAPAAVLYSRVVGCRTWLHVQDFEAEVATGLGIARRSLLFRLTDILEAWLLRCFDRVSSISPQMCQRLLEKGVQADRIAAFPNWVDTRTIHPTVLADELRHELGLVAGDLVLLFSGTLNYKQNIEVVIDAACELQERRELKFVICGSGPELVTLKARGEGLRNLVWLGPQTAERMPQLLSLADIHLLPQRPGAADLVLPSKLGGMLASGRPVITTTESGTEIAEIVTGRGIVVPPADHTALAAAILDLMDGPQARKRLGLEARRYAEANLDKTAVLSKFQDELLRLIRSSAG